VKRMLLPFQVMKGCIRSGGNQSTIYEIIFKMVSGISEMIT
jgi:hypothetical protein